MAKPYTNTPMFSTIAIALGCIILVITYLSKNQFSNLLYVLSSLTIFIGIVLQVYDIKRDNRY